MKTAVNNVANVHVPNSHVNILKVITLIVIAGIGLLSLASCEKEFDIAPRGGVDINQADTSGNHLVKITYSYESSDKSGSLKAGGTKGLVTGTLFNGQTLSFTATGIATIFQTDPATSANWTVSMGGTVVYSIIGSVAFSYNFPSIGSYSMNVNGTTEGTPFNYTATINVSDGTIVNPTDTVGPLRFISLVSVGTNWQVTFRAKKNSSTAANFFWLSNLVNWVHQSAPSVNNDTISIVHIVPKTSTSLVTFNFGFEDGSAGGMWSNASGIFFPNKDLDNNGSTDNLYAYRVNAAGQMTTESGTVILPGNTIDTNIPGNGGEGAFRYTIISSPYSLQTWILYSGTELVYVRYKYNITDTWSAPIVATTATNPNYVTVTVPLDTVGTGEKLLFAQYGAMSGTLFVPFSVNAGMFWSAANQCILLRY